MIPTPRRERRKRKMFLGSALSFKTSGDSTAMKRGCML